jgi:tetrapyrrole methylase family protein/MazG family protein
VQSSQLLVEALNALDIDPFEHGLQIVDAHAFTAQPTLQPTTDNGQRTTNTSQPTWADIQGIGSYTPPLLPFPILPTRPTLICRLRSSVLIEQLARALASRYSAEHGITLARIADGRRNTWRVPLRELDQQTVDEHTCAYLPPLDPLADLRGADGPAYVVARLLGPGGCPWDHEQTHRSLRGALLEETHEVLEALDSGDMTALSEELGDLLLAVLVHSEMARQAGAFDQSDVYEHIAAKLIRRHPHVFGALSVTGTGEVLANWEAIKQAERAGKGKTPRGALDGIPPSLPALATAQELSRKAAKQGFEWQDIADVWEKIHEELDELSEAVGNAEPNENSRMHVVEEYGDVLFILVVLARWLQIDAESALREANTKFRRRFNYVEQQAQAQGRPLASLSLDEMVELWEEAKG